MNAPRYEIGGRAFVAARLTTLRHDVYLSKALLAGGLQDAAMQPDEALDAYSLRILKQLLDADALLRVLSCLLYPAAMEQVTNPAPRWRRVLERLRVVRARPTHTSWTPALALEIETFLGDLTRPEDKDAVYGLTAALLFPFFRNGMRSWASSLPSSKMMPTTPSASPGRPPSAAPTTSPFGADSYAS